MSHDMEVQVFSRPQFEQSEICGREAQLFREKQEHDLKPMRDIFSSEAKKSIRIGY